MKRSVSTAATATRPLWLGLAAALIVTICSYGAGQANAAASSESEAAGFLSWPLDADDERVIAAELFLTMGVVLWALIGPGAGHRFKNVTTGASQDGDIGSKHGQDPS